MLFRACGNRTVISLDTEKLAYVRAVVDAKLEKYDPATKHPKHWLAF